LNTGSLLPTPLFAQLELFTGRCVPELRSAISSAMSRSGDGMAMGLSGRKQTAAAAVQIHSQNSSSRLSGLEAFEGAATAVAWSHDDSSVFVNLRERGRIRLLELASNSLQTISEISVEAAEGRYDPDHVDLTDDEVGATWLLPSPQGRYLVTYGRYPSRDAPYQLRIWKKKSDRWPQDDVKVLTSRTAMIESEMTDTPFQFVGQQDSQLAVVGPQGVGIIDLRTGSVKDTLELPDVANRRPITLFSHDGQWLLAGDQDGNVWTWNLRALQRDPRKLEAQAGPIMGMCLAPGQRFLATVGEENRLRIWTVSTWLKSQTATTSSDSGRLR
jgi:WD40 repeat protein